jgi:hypothetical protein
MTKATHSHVSKYITETNTHLPLLTRAIFSVCKVMEHQMAVRLVCTVQQVTTTVKQEADKVVQLARRLWPKNVQGLENVRI